MYVDYNQEVLDIIGYRKMISPTYSPGSRRSRRGVWWYIAIIKWKESMLPEFLECPRGAYDMHIPLECTLLRMVILLTNFGTKLLSIMIPVCMYTPAYYNTGRHDVMQPVCISQLVWDIYGRICQPVSGMSLSGCVS